MGNAPRGPHPCSEVDVTKVKKRSVLVPGQAAAWYGAMQQNAASQELFRAAVVGDVKAAMSALVRHGSPNCCNAEGFTPLMVAAAGGHVNVVRLLVTSSAKVNAAPNKLSVSALSLAAARGSLDIVQLLFMWKADPEVGRHSGNAPLGRAAALGHLQVCAMLVDQAADVNAWDEQGVTATMKATEHEQLEAVQLLLRSRALVDPVDRMSRSALTRAVEVLMKQEPWGKSQSGLRNPLSEYEYWTETCRYMVELGAVIDLVDASGETLLSDAVKRDREDVVVALLGMRADPDFPVPALSGGSAMMYAIDHRRRILCQALIRNKASVNCFTTAGRTPLYQAVEKCDEEMCFFLLQNGAAYDITDQETGEPLLMKVAMSGLHRVYDHLRLLVELHPVAPEGRMHPMAVAADPYPGVDDGQELGTGRGSEASEDG